MGIMIKEALRLECYGWSFDAVEQHDWDWDWTRSLAEHDPLRDATYAITMAGPKKMSGHCGRVRYCEPPVVVRPPAF